MNHPRERYTVADAGRSCPGSYRFAERSVLDHEKMRIRQGVCRRYAANYPVAPVPVADEAGEPEHQLVLKAESKRISLRMESREPERRTLFRFHLFSTTLEDASQRRFRELVERNSEKVLRTAAFLLGETCASILLANRSLPNVQFSFFPVRVK